jgi:ATP-dependent RNA helicase RhlE
VAVVAARDDAARQEPAVRNPREPQPAPVIIRKESKLDRYPTPEQLDDLPSRHAVSAGAVDPQG